MKKLYLLSKNIRKLIKKKLVNYKEEETKFC